MLSLITLPSASAVISSTSAYSGDFFTEFLPYIWLAVGILVAVVFVKYVRRVVSGGIKGVAGGRRGRGRRRR